MALLAHLNELDQLIPLPSSTHGSIQPDSAKWDQQTHQLDHYIRTQSIDVLLQSTAKVIVGHGISDQTIQVLASLLKTRYYTEYDSDKGDLAGDILEQGLLKNNVAFYPIMIQKIHQWFGRFQLMTLEALLDRYDQERMDKEIIYYAYRYALDPVIPEHIKIIPDGNYPDQYELYNSLKQIGVNGLPPLTPSSQSVPSPILLAIQQKDPELVKYVDRITTLGHYREQIRLSGHLIGIMGPANPSKNCSFTPVFNQGGERMLFDYHYDPEEDDDCTINIEWFIGQCEHIDCLCPIEFFWQAKRIPMPTGGWRGCFCSFNCAKMAASEMEQHFEEYQEDGVEQLIQLDEDRYLPEGWAELFDHMEEQLISHPIIPRKKDNENIDIVKEVFTRLGYYLSMKYPHIDPTWFDQQELVPFLNYSEEDQLDLSCFPENNIDQ